MTRRKEKYELVCGLCKYYYTSKLILVNKRKKIDCKLSKRVVDYYDKICKRFKLADIIWCKKDDNFIHTICCENKKCYRCKIWKILIKNKKEK